jgi:threonine synthase
MITQKGDNTFVIGIHGNFDDAQNGVKAMFNNKELAADLKEKGYQFSSANSINIGRLVPQIVYYVYSYAKLFEKGEIKEGEKINVVVPTGNFGNILAAYYAKTMGVPIDKLICASNENKVLFDFFQTGTYNRNREFILTSSPSMDILISSNLERLIYQIADQDPDKTLAMMKSLSSEGEYGITASMKENMADFVGGYASEDETAQTIKSLYKKTGYVIDTHTAVAASVYEKYTALTGDKTKAIIASTASPYKFTRNVIGAIDNSCESMSDFEQVDALSRLSNTAIPEAIEEIRFAVILHDMVCDKDEMQKTVEEIL